MSETSDEVARLRRRAYGPGATADERAKATAALRLLAQQSLIEANVETDAEADASRAELSVTANADAAGPPLATEPTGVAAGEKRSGRRVAAIWLGPIVAGSLVLGAVGFGLLSQQVGNLSGVDVPTPSLSPTPGSPASESGLPLSGPGDLAAADAWFDSAATARDTFPMVELLRSTEVSPTSVRLGAVAGPEFSVWVGQKDNGDLCLLAVDFSTQQGGSGCIDRAGFEQSGLNLSMPSGGATWSGQEIRGWSRLGSE